MTSVASPHVAEYLRLLREQVARRKAAPGGGLSEEEESEWADRCDAVYQRFSAEECEEAEALARAERGNA